MRDDALLIFYKSYFFLKIININYFIKMGVCQFSVSPDFGIFDYRYGLLNGSALIGF